MKRVAKRVVSRMTETKLFEISPSTPFNSVSTSPSFSYLSPAAGTGPSNRIGRSYTPIRIKAKMLIHGGQSNLATDDSHNVLRITVLRADSGISPASFSYGIGTPLDINKGACKGLREVIYDKEFILDSPGRDSTGYLSKQKWVYINKRLGKKLTMLDDGTTLSSVYNVWMVSDSALSPSPGVTHGYLRWYFKDS